MNQWLGLLLLVMTATSFAALDLPNDPPSATAVTKPAPPVPVLATDEIRAVLDLRDGSHIVGRMTPRNLPIVIRSEAIGEVKIPLERIRGLQFGATNQQVVVTLQNGDKLQGGFALETFKLETAFGKVLIPVKVVARLTASPPGSLASTVEWERVPFPTDCDWPGARGVESLITEDGIVLQGYPVRSRETFSGPLTVTFDVTLEEYDANDGAFNLQFLTEGTPRDKTGEDYVTVCLGYQQRTGGGGHVTVDFRQVAKRLSSKTFTIKKGVAYQFKIEATRDHILININGQNYESTEIVLPEGKFYIRLWGWQPVNRWRVRNISVD